jgi:hypothetical protein
MTILRLATLCLIASAFALGGWVAGSAVFAAAFEILRSQDLDAKLNSRDVLSAFQWAGAAAACVAGAFTVYHWLRPGRGQTAGWETCLAAGLGGAGGFALAHVTDFGGLAGRWLGAGKDAYIVMSVVSWLAMLVFGSALVAMDLAARKSIGRRLMLGAGGVGLAFACVVGAFALGNVAARSANHLGDPPSGWANIRFPADMKNFPDTRVIRTEMRTPLGPDHTHPNEWREENGRKILAVMLRFGKYTRDRQLVVTLPDGPVLVFKPPFPANPKVRFGYGAWIPIDGFMTPDGTFRPANTNDDYAIRYMITR